MGAVIMTRLIALLFSSFLSVSGFAFVAGCSEGGSGALPSSDSDPTNPSSRVPSDPTGRNTVGTWHLQQVDATNLEIKSDGTFRWSIEGCDFGGGDCGTWTLDPDGLGIRLNGTREGGFTWSSDGSFKTPVTSLRVTRTNDASAVLVTDPNDASASKPSQRWESGRVCAICGGNLGPTGQQKCSEPLPDVCASR